MDLNTFFIWFSIYLFGVAIAIPTIKMLNYISKKSRAKYSFGGKIIFLSFILHVIILIMFLLSGIEYFAKDYWKKFDSWIRS